jgi:polysaccharide biosynthesis/export protein
MGRESERPEGSSQATLSLAEFIARSSPSHTFDRAMLVLAESEQGQQVFPIARNPTVIGRSNNADVVLATTGISDFHARIIKHSFGYTVEDLGSAEGTYVGERRVNHARLIDGDSLRLGTTTLRFVSEHQPPTAANVSLARIGVISPTLVPRPTWLRDADGYPGRSHPVDAWPGSPRQLPSRTTGADDVAPSLEELVVKLVRAARYVREHVWLLLGFVTFGVALGAVSYRYYPPVRAAHSIVRLHPAPRVNPIETESRQQQSDSMQFFVGAERAFTSADYVLAALRRMNMPNPSEVQAEALAKRLRFENLGDQTYAATFAPSILSERNDWHVRFLDTHIRNYVESEVAKKLKVFVVEVDFLRSQTDQAQRRLQEIQQETVKYREAHSDQLLAQGSLTPGSTAGLETRKIEVMGRISRLEGELAGIRSQLARGSALSQAKARSAEPDREAMSAINRKLAELRAQGFADGHPEIQRLLAQQANLQGMVEERLHSDVTQFEKRSNAAYDALQGQADQLEAQLRAARAERGTIEASMRDLRTVNSQSPQVNARIEELVRLKEEAERQHALLFDRLQKAEVQLELERVSTTSRFEIVVPARLEAAPGRMALSLRLAFGLAVGLLLAAAILALGKLRQIVRHVTANNAIALLLALVAATGCAHDGRFVWARDLPVQASDEAVIRPRDTLLVEVDKQPSLSGEFVVREDGHYTQPMVGSIAVAGQTPSQVAAALAAALKSLVVSPSVSLWITKVHPIRVSVVGEVKAPGTYDLGRDRSLLAVLAQAGWLTEFAHSDRVFVVRPGASERIRFRVREITAAEPSAARFRLSDADVLVVE